MTEYERLTGIKPDEERVEEEHKPWLGFAALINNNISNINMDTDAGYRRKTVPELLASNDKKLRQIGHILQYYGKY